MKILMVLEHFYPYKGGVEFLFFHLAKSLISNGHTIKVITTLHDASLPAYEVIDGIEIERVRCGNRFLFAVLSIPKIWSNASKYDLIQTTTYSAALPAWICAKAKRKPIIITFHEYWGTLWSRLPYLSGLQRLIFRTFEKIVSVLSYDRIVAVSQFTKKSLVDSGVRIDNVDVIYNGLDYDEIDEIKSTLKVSNSKEKYLLFVGRIGVSKGYDIMIPAVDQFLSNHSEYQWKLVIPKYPEKLAEKIMLALSEMTNFDRVTILHNLTRETLYQVMIGAHSIIVPSYSEGFCFVAAEAQALGVPVISSDQGALKEVVTHKAIKMSKFNVDGLVASLEQMHDKDWWVGDRHKFTLADSADSYISLYSKLIHGK